MAWLTGWSYRKSHVINPATGAGALYQKRIVTYFGSGVDSGENVYLNEKCRTDFGDIRFTKSDGATELDYWRESIETAPSTSGFLGAICVSPDGLTVWACKEGTVYKSTDNGTTWIAKKTFAGAPAYIMGIFVTSTGTILASPSKDSAFGDEGIWRSADGGDNWTKVLSLPTYATIWRFAEDISGNIVAGQYGTPSLDSSKIYRSINDGANWTEVYYDATGKHIHGVWYDKYQDIFYGTQDHPSTLSACKIIKSIDGGANWTTVKSGSFLYRCTAFAAFSGYRLWGSDSLGSDVIGIWKTTDDDAFTRVYNPTSNLCWAYWGKNMDGVAYFGLMGSASGSHPFILKGTDEGTTWATVYDMGVATGAFGSNWGSETDYSASVNKYIFFNDSVPTTPLIRKLDTSTGDVSVPTFLKAVFWVEIADSLESSAQTIYIYYGKADATYPSLATDLAHGEATFILFDNFEDGSYDTAKWSTASGTPVESGGVLTINADDVRSVNTISQGHRLRAKARCTNWTVQGWQLGTVNFPTGNEWMLFTRSTAFYVVSYDGAQTANLLTSGTNDVWYIYEYDWSYASGAGQSAKYYVDDGTPTTHTTNIPDDAPRIRFLSYSSNPTLNIDWIFISKYVSPEPTHGAWGSEEASVKRSSGSIVSLMQGMDLI